MKNLFFAFVLLLIGIRLQAQTRTYSDMADSVNAWLNQRVENAKKGVNEKVQIPMVVRSMGWGCQCPYNYIGVSPATQDGPWIAPVVPKKFPSGDETGHSLIVVGYFTGKMIEEDMRNTDGEPAEWLYKMPEFKILSWKKNEKDYDVDGPKVIGTYKK